MALLRTASIRDDKWSARVEIDVTAAFNIILPLVLKVTTWGNDYTTTELRHHAPLIPGVPFYLWDASQQDGIDLTLFKPSTDTPQATHEITHFIDIMRLPHEHSAEDLVDQLRRKVFALCGATFEHPVRGKPFDYYNVTLCNAVGGQYAGAEMFSQDSEGAAFYIRIHVTLLSCHMICEAMRQKEFTQLPQYVSVSTSYSHKEYKCDVRWNEATTKHGGCFNGPHYDGDRHNAFIWCSRCSCIGCWWSNELCTAGHQEDETSPQWQEKQRKRESNHQGYLERAERKRKREEKKKLGSLAANAFSFKR